MELAVGASEATIKSLLTKLGGLLAEEYALVRGVRGDIQFINDELASMQAFLSNLGNSTDDHDDQTKDWMKQVRDVSYDIEDCVDDFAHGLRPDRQGDDLWSKFLRALYELKTFYLRRSIASQIADLKERAKHVGERRGRYGVRDPEAGKKKSTLGGCNAAEHQETARRLVGIKELVGIEEDMKDLHDWIISDEKELGVLFMFGFGGVGKTTAAMALYRKCGVHFKRRAMITVSHNTDPDVVLRDILSQVRTQVKDQQGQSSTGSDKKNQAAAPLRMPSRVSQLRLSSRKEDEDERASKKQHEALKDELQEHLGKNRQLRTQVKYQQCQSSTGSDKKNQAAAPLRMLSRVSQFRLCSRKEDEDERTSKKEHEALKEELQEHLGKNRYLLLFDDVWSSSMWQTIRRCLPKEKEGSRIIVTTRFEAVARTSRDSRVGHHKFHKMVILSPEVAKDLFEKSLYECRVTQGSQESQNDQVPARVWEMCGGLPLPIVTMAGLVASNKTPTEHTEWIELCNTLFPQQQVCRKPEEFMRIINYCYHVLPSDVKTCSLYLCIFPKGRKISRKRLIRRWISEGFVSEKQGLSVEDVAETCFNQLIERKIIRAVEHSSNGKVKSCQVHDMVLEYIISKAGEENFVTVVGGQWSMPTGSNKVRRLSLHNSDSKSKHAEKADCMNLSHVRSLTVFGSHLPFKSIKTGIVQVLDLEGCRDLKANRVSISDICEMTLLKYLSLRGTDISMLPRNIRNLKYLETLDIRETEIQQLPAAISHLERIRNILGGDKKKRKTLKLPKGLKLAMKELRILSGVEIVEGSTAASDIQMLTRLTKLAIYKLHKDDQMFDDLLSSIQYLSGYALQTLVIDDGSSDFLNTLDTMSAPPIYLSALELSGKLLRLPKWLPYLNDLVKLTLSASALGTINLVTLSMLHSLFSLTFSISAANKDPEMAALLEKNKSDSRGDIFVPVGGFGKLKLLRIFVPLLPSLNFYNKSTPLLERLELRFKRLEGLHGMDKLGGLHDVILTVAEKAGEPTKSILQDLKESSREYALIVNEYHD